MSSLFQQVTDCQAQLQVFHTWCSLAACKSAAVLSQMSAAAYFDGKVCHLTQLLQSKDPKNCAIMRLLGFVFIACKEHKYSKV
jgi:hypothetical protein